MRGPESAIQGLGGGGGGGGSTRLAVQESLDGFGQPVPLLQHELKPVSITVVRLHCYTAPSQIFASRAPRTEGAHRRHRQKLGRNRLPNRPRIGSAPSTASDAQLESPCSLRLAPPPVAVGRVLESPPHAPPAPSPATPTHIGGSMPALARCSIR